MILIFTSTCHCRSGLSCKSLPQSMPSIPKYSSIPWSRTVRQYTSDRIHHWNRFEIKNSSHIYDNSWQGFCNLHWPYYLLCNYIYRWVLFFFSMGKGPLWALGSVCGGYKFETTMAPTWEAQLPALTLVASGESGYFKTYCKSLRTKLSLIYPFIKSV